MSRKQLPEINASSMADIAFLLLIFFLVTTTLHIDAGILKKIPENQKEKTTIVITEKNILEVNINKKNELFVEGKIISLNELKQIAVNFIDNGGGLGINKKECTWCNGAKKTTSSDHPSKAFISIKTDRTTNYETYIAVLDHLNSSYTSLRNKLSVKLYKRNYESLLDDAKKDKTNKIVIQQKIKNIQEKYPLLMSDAEINN